MKGPTFSILENQRDIEGIIFFQEKISAIKQNVLYFDKKEDVSYSIEDDYRDESNEILTQICEENSDSDEESSDVEAKEDTATGTEEIIWY